MSNWKEIYEYLQPKPPLYCPETPSPKQKVFLRSTALEALYGGQAGGGKLLEISSSLLPTPSGFKKLADIHPGDIVFGRDGQPHLVEAESEVQTVNGWTFTFDDGSTVTTNDEHLWLTYDAKELYQLTTHDPEWRRRRREKRPSRAKENPSKGKLQQATVLERNRIDNPSKPTAPPTGSIRTTAEIVATLTVRNGRANHAIPVAEPLQLPEKNLPLDPYVFGAWLGDGSTGKPVITGMDYEIIDHVVKAGFPIQSITSRENNKASQYRFRKLKSTLRDMEAIDKSIPEDYLWGSEEQRLALLQGLLDTDGGVNGNSVEFGNTRQHLTEAVAHLARSLGMKAQVREGRARLNGLDYGPFWRVKFVPNRIVFRLSRKANAQKIATRRTTQFRYIKSAERVYGMEMKCLRVSSPDNLFLVTEDFIPTHNSSALLMAGLQFVDVKGYTGIFFRRTYADLALPGALMDRFIEWIKPYDEISWNSNTYTATFPSGARLTFGYLNNVDDRLRYKSSQFQYIAMDEVTEIREADYKYLFSRLRRPKSGPASQIPLRMRTGSNPAPNWVRQRFIVEGEEKNRVFVKASLEENPGIDIVSYKRSLAELDPIERRRLEFGDWWASSNGTMFSREDFVIIDPHEIPIMIQPRIVRYWDLAGTKPSAQFSDPDWTVGILMILEQGVVYILDVKRFREDAATVERIVRQTAIEDGPHIPIRMEQEPGSSGKGYKDHYARTVLLGHDFQAYPQTGDKETRAKPLSSAVANGNVRLVRGPWLSDFLDEFASYPEAVSHDDQVDATSGGYNELTGLGGKLRRPIEIVV